MTPASRRIGICREHFWWFPLPAGAPILCPEPRCTSAVDIYTLAHDAHPSEAFTDGDDE